MKRMHLLPLALLWAGPAFAATANEFHHHTLLFLAVLFAAKMAGILGQRLGLPSLVGEILGGVVLGNLALFGIESNVARDLLGSDFFIYVSELGVVFLLFLVGLESNLADLARAGFNSVVTAVIGVILPTVSGFLLVHLLGLGGTVVGLLFGATFAATSVGITAKMLTEAGKLKTASAQIVLGAAVVDDVLGLMLLAVIQGLVVAQAGTGAVNMIGLIGWIVVKVCAFFICALLFGRFVLPQVFKVYKWIEQPGLLTVVSVLLALVFADLAGLAGLAPIVGAFTAGLLLDEVKFRHAGGLKAQHVEEVIQPITDLLLPVFFVFIGLHVDVLTLVNPQNLAMIALLLVIAVIGKAVCGFACRGKGIDRLGIGLGMIPRGEVGLIFATFGLKGGVVTPEVYSVLVLVVLLTTILGPLLLKLRLHRY